MIVSCPNLKMTLGIGSSGVKRLAIVGVVAFLAASLSFACDDDEAEIGVLVSGPNSTAPVESSGSGLDDSDIVEGSRALGGIPVK